MPSMPTTPVAACAFILAFGTPAWAERLAYACTAAPPGQTGKLSILFDNDRLLLSGQFGDAAIRASKSVATKELGGKRMSIVTIQGTGPATLAMPDKRALEACIANRLDPSTKDDKDMVLYFAMGCSVSLPHATPTPIKLRLALIMVDSPDPDILMERTFQESSPGAGGPISILGTPEWNCRAVN